MTGTLADDLGDVRIDGVIWRSSKTQGMPFNVSVSWNSVPIAEFIQLTTGAKVEWRGQLNASARFEGNPHDLHITATGNVSDFKAALNSDARHMQVACNGQIVDRVVDISCTVPSDPAGLVISVTGPLDQPKITAGWFCGKAAAVNRSNARMDFIGRED